MLFLNIEIFFLILFFIGICGVFTNRKNLIIILMSIELILLSIVLSASFYSVVLDDLHGQIMALFIVAVAGAESSIGLAILVSYYRLKGTISTSYVKLIKH